MNYHSDPNTPQPNRIHIKSIKNRKLKIPCLWLAPLSMVWHQAHLVLKIFSPTFGSPGGASENDAIFLSISLFGSSTRGWESWSEKERFLGAKLKKRVRELLKFLGKRRIFEKRWLRKRAWCFFFDFADGSELGMLAAVTMRLREAWRLREW